MKISFVCGRVDKKGKHNDRNFDTTKASHIDDERTKDNLYYLYTGEVLTHEEKGDLKLEQIEKNFYAEHFTDHLKWQRQRNAKNNHYARNKSVAEYMSSRNSQPEDMIIEIGNCETGSVTPEELWACAMEYKDAFEKHFGDYCKIIDMSLHCDENQNHFIDYGEVTAHVHVRRSWIDYDDGGNECVCQERSLKRMGISLPDEEMPIGRHNNRKMVFTDIERNMFSDICIAHGMEIEKTERTKGDKKKHLEILDYKTKKRKEEVNSLEAKVHELSKKLADYEEKEGQYKEFEDSLKGLDELEKTLENILKADPYFQGLYNKTIDESKSKSRAEYFKLLVQIYTKESEIFAHYHTKNQELQIKEEVEARMKAVEKILNKHGQERLLEEIWKEQETRRKEIKQRYKGRKDGSSVEEENRISKS
jgi:hypothetical protein